MPWILLALGIGLYMSRRKREKLAALPRLRVDANMPASLRQEVVRAMESEADPKTLSQFAESLDRTYPYAAYELRMKAWIASGRQGPLPAPPAAAA